MAWTTPTRYPNSAEIANNEEFLNVNVIDNLVELRSYQNRFASYRYVAGNVTLNSSATWANLPTIGTAGDLTLNASAGDVIEVGISGLISNAATATGFDVVTIVSASPVNSFGNNGAVAAWASFQGISAWSGTNGAECQLAGSFAYTLAAGDINAGTVTLRIRSSNTNATTRTLYANAVNPFSWFAKNLGPATS